MLETGQRGKSQKGKGRARKEFRWRQLHNRYFAISTVDVDVVYIQRYNK